MPLKFDEYLKFWPIILALVSFISGFTLLQVRLSSVEARQDRQANSIMELQKQVNTQATNYATVQAKLENISENVSYIRSRIDNATK